MRISDWSSDVCSSDLNAKALVVAADAAAPFGVENQVGRAVEAPAIAEPDRTFIGETAAGVGIARLNADEGPFVDRLIVADHRIVLIGIVGQIGRAECRERVCQLV